MSVFHTSIPSKDGFGAQYQRIIQTYILCKQNNLNFVYNSLKIVEHNYTNDIEYNKKLESLMNLKNNIVNLNTGLKCDVLDYGSIVMPYFEKNIDACCESEHMKFIKECFWENKQKPYFNNGKLNVAVHIRRENIHDKGLAGDRASTPNSYYLHIMNCIRNKYTNKEILFHIYSQGNILNFKEIVNSDVCFYLNHDITDSFIGMVSADILITSPSCLSYVAALISDGEIYYKKFWHNPRKNWIICG
jgi:hypothetical protein